MIDDNQELKILGEALDIVLAQKTREQQIAALRCFVRGLSGKLPLRSDFEILEIK